MEGENQTTEQQAPQQPQETSDKSQGASKYKCKICAYIYDPEKGDTGSGVQPGTPFEGLPEGWVCPLCGAGKDMFEKI